MAAPTTSSRLALAMAVYASGRSHLRVRREQHGTQHWRPRLPNIWTVVAAALAESSGTSRARYCQLPDVMGRSDSGRPAIRENGGSCQLFRVMDRMARRLVLRGGSYHCSSNPLQCNGIDSCGFPYAVASAGRSLTNASSDSPSRRMPSHSLPKFSAPSFS